MVNWLRSRPGAMPTLLRDAIDAASNPAQIRRCKKEAVVIVK
jgi:hypothetical protein